jgi:ABC-type multidrug transport system ATPase subunit
MDQNPIPAIRIRNVSKHFDDIRALVDVSFDVPPHSVFGLLGPNGAGKTTLFSIVANFLKADNGTIEVLGHDTRHTAELQGRLSILPQDAAFQRSTPILEQLVFFRRLDGQDRAAAREEVSRTLELVGLGEYAKRGARALSHGMMKRLGVAQAFLGTPEVILLDEPTSGLDPANVRQIRNLILELRERTTVVLSSHNLAEIQELCDHVAILDKGRVVTCGPVAELTSSARELDLRLSRPLDEHEIARLTGLAAVASVDPGNAPDYALRLDLDDGRDWDDAVASVLRTLLDLGAVPRRFYEGQSLEQHFLSVTGGNGEGPDAEGPSN